MNRKNNPYVSLVAVLLLALILVLTCTGCRAEAAEIEPANRYTYEVESHPWGPTFCTITDTQTGNQYLYVYHGTNQGKAGGLTKLEG